MLAGRERHGVGGQGEARGQRARRGTVFAGREGHGVGG